MFQNFHGEIIKLLLDAQCAVVIFSHKYLLLQTTENDEWMKHIVFITRKKKMNEAFRAVKLKLQCKMSYIICKSAQIC